MKKITFFFLFFLIASGIFSQNNIDEYGTLNSNRYLSGLGMPNSYVYVSYDSTFEQNVEGTLEMWINPSSFSGTDKTLISKGAASNVSFLWGLRANTGKMYFRIGTTDFEDINGAAPILNAWNHVAVAWEGAPNYTVYFYVDGTEWGSPSNGTASWNLTTDEIRIGGSQAFPENAFTGFIDEVRYWASSLPLHNIASNRFTGIGDAPGANTNERLTNNSYYTSLISSWTFNQTDAAFDYIGGFNGTYTGQASTTEQITTLPMPYNLALKLGGGSTDYVIIPDNSIFNQSTDGTIDLWFYPISFSTDQILLSKGSSPATVSFILGVAENTGKLYFGCGSSFAQNNSGAGLELNQWNHLAVTWEESGNNFLIKFYKNGKLNGTPSDIARNFPVNSSNLCIGNSHAYDLPAKGYMDEVRLWEPALAEEQIKNYMFVSSRGIDRPDLLAAWNFDGNLNNVTAVTGINGSFDIGSSNNCRFSGYLYEDVPGGLGVVYVAHTTVINRKGLPNPFPGGFTINAPFVTIADNSPDGVVDSILISNYPGKANSVEIFLSVQHRWVNDLTITLKAPNGQIRTLMSHNGGSANHILSFFNDNFNYNPSSCDYLPPWGFEKPLTPFEQFGGTTVEGIWAINCIDTDIDNVGVLRGWGIRFNNLINVEPVSGQIPDKFNLYQNYPNPFNPSTNIKFDIPKNENVNITLFDVLGREVLTLINEYKKAGEYIVVFDGSNLSSGTYFYRIAAGGFVDTKKMVLIK